MRVAILGGKLQGVEATYLMHKAGWETVVIDKNEQAAAAELADEFHCFDLWDKAKLCQVLKSVDFVIPALEKKALLTYMKKTAKECKKEIMFDCEAYAISCSKLLSDKLFAQIGVPAPRPYPACEFPITVKPSGMSGSEYVQKLETQTELDEFIKKNNGIDGWVVQEFLAGPSYSIEVIARQGRMKTFQVTELEMDEVYDCKRVISPSMLSSELEQQFAECAVKLAEAVMLDGIMDVEVILNKGQLKVLEIDARLPSQTLTAVYNSTGIIAPQVWQQGVNDDAFAQYTRLEGKGVVYEHIQVSPEKLKVCGEHIMGDLGRLHYFENFFGADEAISDFKLGSNKWSATLIITAPTRAAALEKHKMVIKNIMQAMDVEKYEDLVPEN